MSCIFYPQCACASPTMCGNILTPQRNQPNLHQMITEQNPERRTEQRKPTTSLDWELQQALIHLQNAISVTDSRRGHLLQAAVQIAKGVRESE